jgi:hypothetical protein
VDVIGLLCDDAGAYAALGNELGMDERVVVGEGRAVGKRELSLEAVRCDVTNAAAYKGMLKLLTGAETMALYKSKRGGLSNAIARNADDAFADALLSLTLTSSEALMLWGGQRMKAGGLLMEAIRRDDGEGLGCFFVGLRTGEVMRCF